MDTESQLKIIRLMILVMLISSIHILGFSGYYYFQEPEKITTLGTKPVTSGFGEINLYDPENSEINTRT